MEFGGTLTKFVAAHRADETRLGASSSGGHGLIGAFAARAGDEITEPCFARLRKRVAEKCEVLDEAAHDNDGRIHAANDNRDLLQC